MKPGPTIILATVDSWIQPTLPKGVYESLHEELAAGSDIGSREELRSKLRALGYTQAETVEEPGQFAVRGEILDLYVPTQATPYRIEFFDTVIETIRPFHAETQRTIKTEKTTQSLCITAAEEVIFPWNEQSVVLETIKEYSDHHQITRKVRDPIFENIRNGFLTDNYRTWIPFIYSSYGALSDYLPKDVTLITFEPEQIRIEFRQAIESLKREEARYEQPHWISPKFDPSLFTRGRIDFNRNQTGKYGCASGTL